MSMQQNAPLQIKEVFNLTKLGKRPELFKPDSVTFESQKYICVKDTEVSFFNITSIRNINY